MKKHLLLLHGALADESQIYPLRDLLTDHAIVHVHTFSGHGKKISGKIAYSMDQFAREIIELAKNLYSPPDIFGYSMGGYAGLCAAHASQELGKVITLGTKFDWNAATAERAIQFLDPEKILEKTPQFAQQLELIHGSQWKEVVIKTAEMMLHLGHSAPLDAKALSEIKNEVLLLVGDQDITAGMEASRKAAMLLPNSSFSVLDKTQHPFEKTNPAAIADRICAFLYK